MLVLVLALWPCRGSLVICASSQPMETSPAAMGGFLYKTQKFQHPKFSHAPQSPKIAITTSTPPEIGVPHQQPKNRVRLKQAAIQALTLSALIVAGAIWFALVLYV